MLDIIDRVLRSQNVPRSLSADARKAFKDGNTDSFTLQYKNEKQWQKDCKNLIRAAKLHGRLVLTIVDFADPDGTKYPEIPTNILKAAGVVVRFLCPKIMVEGEPHIRSGAWCDWP